ncbi:MAG: lysoplasmalogenase [Prevotellaceae bacterium]|nr:lysoplasmalogenase [Prevotellaceae bacterium]
MKSNILYNGLILVPLVCAIVALVKYSYCFHVAVPVLCAVLIIFLSHKVIADTKWLLVAALAFSIAGDWMLKQRNGQTLMFVYGIALFFIAHAGFLLFCLKNGKIHLRLLLVSVLGYGIFFFSQLLPAIGDWVLSASVFVYMLISCFSLAGAYGLRLPVLSRRLFFAGIACIVFSDTLIACCEFLNSCGLYHYVMMPTYYAAHIFITAAVIYRSSISKELSP